MTREFPRSTYYCCYRLQAEKRVARGETTLSLEKCVQTCTGYNNRCEHYTPQIKIQRN